MNGNEIQRLAHAINAHRPDWMIASLTTFLTRHMSAWPYRDAAVALTFVACDSKVDGTPASDTPKRVLEQGPWRAAAAIGGSTAATAHAPKPHEECPTHPGRFAHNCGGCHADQLAAEADPPSPDLPPVADVNPRLAKRLAEMRSER